MSNHSNTLRRLQKEWTTLLKEPVPNVTLSLPSDDDLFSWTITLRGPSATPYEAGIFNLSMTFPSNYPFKPPTVLFLTKIYHPNVKTETGQICEHALGDEGWSPTLTVRHILNTVITLMKCPDADHPLEEKIATLLMEKPKEFEKIAKQWTKEYAK